jgi:hypothetical protein
VGGARLRDGALSSGQVIGLVNQELIPVWINVRTDPWPRLPALRPYEWQLALGPDRRALSVPMRGFFVRSYVVSPDGLVLLNDEEGATRRILADWQLYLDMLQRALARRTSASSAP